MGAQAKLTPRYAFGDYELDCRTLELRRSGVIVKLQPQPAKVLSILISRQGEIVTREELTEQVWGADRYVDFEHGLNFAIRKIRSVLEDDAENPRYLQTVPKRGYRFIAAVNGPIEPPATEVSPTSRTATKSRRPIIVTSLFIAAGLVITAIYARQPQTTTAHRIRSLAVLPLRNLSGDPEQEYFSEGITDELITDLAKLPNLRVISHTSMERYKDTKRPLPDIAHELGVDAIVEGTVTRSGEHVRVTAQFIDGHSDQHLWADRYERDIRDVLMLQDEVATEIADQIGIKLGSGLQPYKANRRVDPVAHEAYMRGAFYLSHLTCREFEKALGYFQEAVARDPSFAPAYVRMADAFYMLRDWRCPMTATFDDAESAARKALALDASYADPHIILGEIAFARDWNWAKANEEYTKAVRIDPNDSDAHSSYAVFLVAMGRKQEALAEIDEAQKLDPVSEDTNMDHTYILYLAHEFDLAIQQAKQTLDLIPQSKGMYYWIGQCYEQKGLSDKAITYYLAQTPPEDGEQRRAAYQKDGLAGYWRLDEEFRRRMKYPIDERFMSLYYAHEGEKEKAIEQLQLAYRKHIDGLQFLKVEPVFDLLRDDPRFNELLVRMGLS